MKSGLGDESLIGAMKTLAYFPLSLQCWRRSFTFSRAFIFSHDPNLRIWFGLQAAVIAF